VADIATILPRAADTDGADDTARRAAATRSLSDPRSLSPIRPDAADPARIAELVPPRRPRAA